MRRAVCLSLSGLFLLLIAIAAAVTTPDDAFAERSTNYPGFGCLSPNESLGLIRRTAGYVYNSGTSLQWVYCPVVRRQNFDDDPHQVHVNTIDNSTTQAIVCYFYISHPHNFAYEFTSSSTGVAFTGLSGCSHAFSDLSGLDQWYNKLVVQLPGYDATLGGSKILSYEVFEDEIPHTHP